MAGTVTADPATADRVTADPATADRVTADPVTAGTASAGKHNGYTKIRPRVYIWATCRREPADRPSSGYPRPGHRWTVRRSTPPKEVPS